MASQTARTLKDLGDHRNTERHYRAALSERDPKAFRRIHALTFLDWRRDVPVPQQPPGDLRLMVMLAVSVIVHDRETERVVLLRRGDDKAFAPGLWSLPSGKGAPGEPITQTAVRELREETGLHVKPQALRLVHVQHSANSPDAPEGFVVLVFATNEWDGDPVNAEPGKHATVAWVGVDELPDAFVPTTLYALRRYLAGEPPKVAVDGWGPE